MPSKHKHARYLLPLIALVLGVVLTADTGCGHLGIPVDLSSFEEFRLERFEVISLCVDEGSVYSGTISREGDRYVVELAILEKLLWDVDECPVEKRPPYEQVATPCPVLRELPARELADGEVQRMLNLFGDLKVHLSPAVPPCGFAIYDTCTVTYFNWDGFAVADFFCSHPYMDEEQASAILNFLEDLRTG